jgi:hypothetical protein
MPRNRPPRPGTTYPASKKSAFNTPAVTRATTTSYTLSSSRIHLYRFKDRPTEPISARHQTPRLDQRGTATTTSIRRASPQRAPWTRESQPTSHAAYRRAPAQPTRRAQPYVPGPNVQRSAATEGRQLQRTVRRPPPRLMLLIAPAGREPLRGPPAAHVARPPRGYHKHAGRGQPGPPSARESRPRFTTAKAPDKQLLRVARQPRHASALSRPRATSTRQPRLDFSHEAAQDR